nr:hypothetical protein [Tanacetum cinerariifolium]
GVDDGRSSGGGSGWMVCVDWGDVGVVMKGVAWGWQPPWCRGWR